jgi:hypothetical protein
MPVLDSCIDGIFTPGNIGASSGAPPTQPVVGSVYDPNDPSYVSEVTPSLDFTRFYNSQYFFLLIAW